jgi:outer membrane protein assembly factor BamB
VGADVTIYVVADSGVTYALNPDKSLKWDPPFDPLGLVSFPPVPTAGGSVYVFDDNNDINSLHLVGPTGIGVSTFTDLPNTLAQPPVVGADGTLYLVDGGSNLYVMSPAEVTTSTQADQISAPPAVATDGTIYWVESSTDVYILNPDLSQKFEPFTPPGGANISEAPVIASDGSVYVFDDANSLLYKINPATGVGAPFTALTGVVYKPAAGPDGAIYLDDNGTGNDELYGLNPNGTDKWAPFLPPGLLTINSVPGVGADGTVAFTGDDGNVYAVHSTSVLP